MRETSLQRLQHLCTVIPALLSGLNEGEFSYKPSVDKWSKKEILGHLIASAANNHQRFVRCQFEDTPAITYDQNKWNSFSRNASMDSTRLIALWTVYNNYIADLARLIPSDLLGRTCNVGTDAPVTLEWLFDDYVRHLEHHLKQLVEYD